MPVGFDEWSAGAGTVESGGLSVAVHDRGNPGDPVFTYCHGYPSSSHDVLPVLELLDGWRRWPRTSSASGPPTSPGDGG